MAPPSIGNHSAIPGYDWNTEVARARHDQPVCRVPVQLAGQERGVDRDLGSERGLSDAWARHHPSEPCLWVGHELDYEIASGSGLAQRPHFPRRNRRDEYPIRRAGATYRRRRRTRHGIAVGKPNYCAGIEQHRGRQSAYIHRWITSSSAAKASSAMGAVKSISGGTTTDPRKNPCNRSTSPASAAGGTRTATGTPRFVTTTRSTSLLRIRSRMSRHFALNSLALTIRLAA